MDRRQKLIIAALLVLCFVVIGSFINEFFGFFSFAAYEIFCTVLFSGILYAIRKEFKNEFARYLAYFCILYALVLYSAFALVNIKEPVTNMDIFIILIMGIIVINILFRVIFGKSTVEGKVILSDSEIAVVELPFDLFAGISSGRYVVETSKKLEKGKIVKVLIKRTFFKRIPDRVL